ncbi:MAG: sugar transporter permease [Chloroflexi bacterium]|jgi:ABC-type glycerol-3-phosphate transport system permease component|nr:sugar transporter permease [Chloroflexota bacterium]
MAMVAGQRAGGAQMPPTRRRYNGAWIARRTLLWVLNLFFLFFFLFPLYWQTVTSFRPENELGTTPIQWFPTHFDLSHYYNVFNGPVSFAQNILNSVIVSTAATLLSLLIGTFSAYALARLPLPAKRTILVLVIVMVTFPGIALVAALFIFLRDAHLTNTYWALILPYCAFSLPFAIWVLTSFFRDIPPELSEQAEVDGCTPLQSLIRVILPLSMPALVTAGLLIFIGAWNEFLFAYTFIDQPSMQTVPVSIYYFGGLHNLPWGEISAAAEVVSLPIIALVLIFQRGIVQGLTAGSLKG